MKSEKAALLFFKHSLIAIYFTDALTKYFIIYIDYDLLILPNRYIKALMIACSIVITATYFKKLYKVTFYIYTLLSIILITSLINNFFYDTNLNYLLKYSYFFVLAPLFFIDINRFEWEKEVGVTLKYLVYTNFLFVVVGLIMDFQFFKTYHGRFGFNGLLITPMQATYFYIFSIIIAIKLKQRWFLLLSLISALFVGTKILYGFLFTIAIYSIITKLNDIKARIQFGFASVTIFTIIFYFLLRQQLFVEIINSKGLPSAIMSHRNDLLITFWHKLSTINYNIFSGGISLTENRVEMEIIDSLMYFGIIGLVAFFFLFRLLKISFIKDEFSALFFYVLLFFISIGGNFLYYPINCFCFLITLKTLSIKTTK